MRVKLVICPNDFASSTDVAWHLDSGLGLDQIPIYIVHQQGEPIKDDSSQTLPGFFPLPHLNVAPRDG
jgi:hypothetical protein